MNKIELASRVAEAHLNGKPRTYLEYSGTEPAFKLMADALLGARELLFELEGGRHEGDKGLRREYAHALEVAGIWKDEAGRVIERLAAAQEWGGKQADLLTEVAGKYDELHEKHEALESSYIDAFELLNWLDQEESLSSQARAHLRTFWSTHNATLEES